MRIFVKVKTGAKNEKIERIDPVKLPKGNHGAGATHFIVSVKDQPISGKANIAVIEAIAEFLDIAPSRINIVRGLTSRNKVFEVL